MLLTLLIGLPSHMGMSPPQNAQQVQYQQLQYLCPYGKAALRTKLLRI